MGRGPNQPPQRGARLGGFTPSRAGGGQDIVVTIGPHAGKAPQSYRFPLSGQMDFSLGSFTPAKTPQYDGSPANLKRPQASGSHLFPELEAPADPKARRQLEDQYYKARYAEKIIRQLIEQYNAGPGATSGFLGALKDLAPTQANRDYNHRWQIMNEYGPSLLGDYYDIPAGTSAWTNDNDQAERLNHLLANAQAAQRDAVRGLQATPDKNGVLVPLARPPGPAPQQHRPSSQTQAGSSPPQAKQPPAIVQLHPPPPAAQAQETKLAKGNTKDVIDEERSAKISALIRDNKYDLDQINTIVPSTLNAEQLAYSRELAKNPNFNGKDLVTFIIPKEKNAFERFDSEYGAGIISYTDKYWPSDWFIDDTQKQLRKQLEDAHPIASAIGQATGILGSSMTLGPLKEAAAERFFPGFGETIGGIFGVRPAWSIAGGAGGYAKSKIESGINKYIDSFEFDFLKNNPYAGKFLKKGIGWVVDKTYDAGKERLESLFPEQPNDEVSNFERGGQFVADQGRYSSKDMWGAPAVVRMPDGSLARAGTPVSLLSPKYGQPEPVFRSYTMPGAPWMVRQHGALVLVDQLPMAGSDDLLRSNNRDVPAAAGPAPTPKVAPQAAPSNARIPTPDHGTADFYAQLDQLKRNADAMAAGPYPNPGDAARAAQLVDPRPVYPTEHPYGFGAGFEPDQVASGRPYAVAPQAAAVPADDQGTIVYRTQPPTFNRYGAQPGVGLYGDAGGDPHYGLSYDDGAGGYAQDGLDGFDFLSPASVHAGGWQHPADMSGQGAGLLVATPGARFGYGGAARSPVIGGFIPRGLGAPARSDGSGGGSGSVPLYSSYNNNGAGDWGAQPDVSLASDPSGWSPRSAVRSILAIAPDDGQAAPNWLDPNAPPPQIMLNIPDLSGLIR